MPLIISIDVIVILYVPAVTKTIVNTLKHRDKNFNELPRMPDLRQVLRTTHLFPYDEKLAWLIWFCVLTSVDKAITPRETLKDG